MLNEENKEDNGKLEVYDLDSEAFMKAIRNLSLFHISD